MKLSIIICVYNTEKKYFDACLKSIRESTLKKDEYEIVVIDDGSQENYDEIIKKYDPVYVKTSNRGLLSARLYGATIAKGDYIAFCDADDTVSFNYYYPMLKKGYSENADIVLNDWAFDTSATKYACKSDITQKTDLLLENNEILRFLTASKGRMHSNFVQWNKIFKRQTFLSAKKELEKTDVFSNKPFVYSEDVISNFFVFKNAKKLVNTHSGYYFYRVHSAQSVSTKDEEALKNEVSQMALTFDIMLTSIPQNEFADEIKENIISWRAYMARKHYSYAKMNKLANSYDFIKEKYHQEKLKTAKLSDSVSYLGAEILGSNLNQIDTELYRFLSSSSDVNLIYDKKDKYVSKMVEMITSEYGKRISSTATKLIVIPKRKISCKHKITHSKPVGILGAMLFKKGSKMRARLKNQM